MSVIHGLIFLTVLLTLYTQHILYFVLPEIKFQSLEVEYLPPQEVNLDAKILVNLLLQLCLCLINLHLFVLLVLVFDHL